MGSMRFMSTMEGRPPKLFAFDSSPGRAIAQAMGNLDEKSYQSELKETLSDGEEVYEIKMRRNPPESEPDKVMPLVKVGVIHYRKPVA